MDRPILNQIVNEVGALFDALPKGPEWDQVRWERERIAIIKRYGYREKPLRRALAAERSTSAACKGANE